jgi:P-type Cu+ transporter
MPNIAQSGRRAKGPRALSTYAITSAEQDAPDPAAEEAREAEARRAEVRELSRRVAGAALLTAPVLFAVMAHDLFGASWVPALLLNRWWQLVLSSPVMFFAGAPIHRTGGSPCTTAPRT